MPGWRTPKPPAPKMAPKAEAEIIARSRGLVDAARRSRPSFLDSGEDVEHLVIERHIPKQRGNWRMFSAAVEASSDRSEEHTSELQSLMRISYAVFCLRKKNNVREL